MPKYPQSPNPTAPRASPWGREGANPASFSERVGMSRAFGVLAWVLAPKGMSQRDGPVLELPCIHYNGVRQMLEGTANRLLLCLTEAGHINTEPSSLWFWQELLLCGCNWPAGVERPGTEGIAWVKKT